MSEGFSAGNSQIKEKLLVAFIDTDFDEELKDVRAVYLG